MTKKLKAVRLAPHLALTHELTDGAANGRNVSLLMKSKEDLTEDQKELLISLKNKNQDLVKASHNAMRAALEEAIKDSLSNKWDWSWVHDFDSEGVVYSIEGEVKYSKYTLSDGVVELSDTKDVTSYVNYEDKAGNLVMSGSLSDIGDGAKLLQKSLIEINSNKELLKKFNKHIGDGMTQEDNQDKQELVKALADLTKAKEDLVKANETIETLQKSVADYKQAEVEAEASRRVEMAKSVQQDEEKAQELLKSLESLDSEAFNTVIKAMQEKVEAVETSDLFKQTSVTKSDNSESTLAEMLKAKHSK